MSRTKGSESFHTGFTGRGRRCARAAMVAATMVVAATTGDARADEGNQMMANKQSEHTNRLIHATSPYLLQHAHNPVDWYEWGPEAFKKAETEGKLIFLSIGYAACHWCHVMEHETFESEAVAEQINDRFVCIKVDREERPDVDEIYMQATMAMNQGQGGWPMSVFLLPDRRPVYAGTYFPRDHFLGLCDRLHQLWTEDRAALVAQGGKLQEYLSEWAQGPAADETLIDQQSVDAMGKALARHIDLRTGGFRSEGNKFPPSMAMELMLRVGKRTNDPTLLEAVEVTLDNMARGGIYDHLGGGICRYSTDPDWLVPHFEKMLYDQALVSRIYLDAYQATENPMYADIARDIFNYVISDLQAPEGGFYSTRDADSEGLEGAYYLWTVEQVHAVLGAAEGALFCEYYDVTERGNWFESRGHAPAGPKNVLHISTSLGDFSTAHGLSDAALRLRIADWRAKLLAARAQRVPPALDDKILSGWNGLMIAALAQGARVLDDPQYAVAAGRAADFVLTRMRTDDGRLLRTYRGGTARLTGYLNDYAFMIEGLLNLYEATFDRRWLTEAVKLNDLLIEHYHDEAGGAFFFIADDAEALIARTKNPRDGAIPSGNSVQALNLLRLAKLYDRKDYRALAEGIFRAFKPIVASSPGQFERLLCAVDFYHGRPWEIAVVGPVDADATRRLVRAVFAEYVPNKVVAHAVGADDAEQMALLRGKTLVGGAPAVYVCQDYRCKKPATTAAGLREQLGLPATETRPAPTRHSSSN